MSEKNEKVVPVNPDAVTLTLPRARMANLRVCLEKVPVTGASQAAELVTLAASIEAALAPKEAPKAADKGNAKPSA